MHWRYRLRMQQLLDECAIHPKVFEGGIERLAEFARPFAERLVRREQRDHARTYLAGLVSDLKRKSTESIAYFYSGRKIAIAQPGRYLEGASLRHEPVRV